MSKRLAIIHTTPATIEPLKGLAAELLDGVEVVNFVDDSILGQLAANAADLSQVEGRLVQYASFAEEVGADVILEACSSVGELVKEMQRQVSVPVVRIDEAMAEQAVCQGRRIGIAATLATTLNPTMRLLSDKARAFGREVELVPVLVKGAYEKLAAGDKEGHDALLVEALTRLASRVDLVVLAQASMARVIPKLPLDEQGKFVSSPRGAMERVKKILQAC